MGSILHDFNFVVGEVVEFVNEFVDLVVGGVDLSLESGFFVGDLGGGDVVPAVAVLVVGEVEGAGGGGFVGFDGFGAVITFSLT